MSILKEVHVKIRNFVGNIFTTALLCISIYGGGIDIKINENINSVLVYSTAIIIFVLILIIERRNNKMK